MGTRLDIEAYLQRIGYSGSVEPNLNTLRALHYAHLLAVPFENLDIHLGRPIILDEAAFFQKLVRGRRGGFCYELNGLFSQLLKELGFRVTLLSARVAGAAGYAPEFDHLTLLVELEALWLADVGFGDSFREPLQLDDRNDPVQPEQVYRIEQRGDVLELARLEDGAWVSQYSFTLLPRELGDFAGMCLYHQTSPDSPFTQQRVCSLATPGGRISLSGMKLITTVGAERSERVLSGEEEYREILRERFGIEMPGLTQFTAPSRQ